MNLILIIIFIISITALILGSLAYTNQSSSERFDCVKSNCPQDIPTSQDNWANISTLDPLNTGRCRCTKVPYKTLRPGDEAVKTLKCINNVIPKDSGWSNPTDQPTQCYDSQKTCEAKECIPDKTTYTVTGYWDKPDPYCDCSSGAPITSHDINERTGKRYPTYDECIKAPTPSGCGRSPPQDIPTSQDNWANISTLDPLNTGRCRCTKVPYKTLRPGDEAVKTLKCINNVIPKDSGWSNPTDQPTQCYDSQKTCEAKECIPDKTTYTVTGYWDKPDPYCDCSSGAPITSHDINERTGKRYPTYDECIKAPTPSGCGRSPPQDIPTSQDNWANISTLDPLNIGRCRCTKVPYKTLRPGDEAVKTLKCINNVIPKDSGWSNPTDQPTQCYDSQKTCEAKECIPDKTTYTVTGYWDKPDPYCDCSSGAPITSHDINERTGKRYPTYDECIKAPTPSGCGRSPPQDIPTSQDNWANISTLDPLNTGRCRCTKVPYKTLRPGDEAVKTLKCINNVIPKDSGWSNPTDQPTQCYDSQKTCEAKECIPDKTTYTVTGYWDKPDPYCDCSSGAPITSHDINERTGKRYPTYDECIKAPTPSGCGRSPPPHE